MITFLEKVKEKINNKLNPEHVLLIDNSNLHAKHKTFNLNKYYLKLVIKSRKLKNMSKIEAHKIIFSVLTTKRTKYKYYIEVLDQLKQAGATKISIANPNN